MLKTLKVVFLIVVVGLLWVVFNEISAYNYIYPEYQLKHNEREITSVSSIISQDQAHLVPVKYLGSIDFDTIPEDSRKALFINFMLPAIVIERDRLLDHLRHVEFIEERMVNKLALRNLDIIFFKELMEQYEATSIKDLKVRLYPHPVSLVLAQAALESGWGTSKVFSKANNPFGIRSFSTDEPRKRFILPENQKDAYFRSYTSINQSVEHYFFFTSTLSSYEKFRKKRWERGSSVSLVKYLNHYHESDDYNQLVKSIIDTNDLIEFDKIAIEKEYQSYRKNYFQLLKSFIREYL